MSSRAAAEASCPCPPETVTPASRGALLVTVLGILTALAPFAIDMYLPALPWIARDLQADAGSVQLTLSVFMIGVAFGQAVYGPMIDRWGRRGPLLVGMVIFVLASVGCAFAPTLEWLLLGRLVMALGGSASMVIPRAVVRDFFDEHESARVYSLLMLILGVSPILAPTVGGQLIDFTGWRGIFGLLAIIGVISTLASLRWLPESLPPERRTRASVAQAFRTYGRLITDVRFAGPAISAGFAMGAIFAYLSGSAFVFMELFGLSARHYALVFGFNAIGLIAASQINRQLLQRFTPRQVIATAFVASALFGLALAVIGATGWGGLPLMVACLFLSLGAVGVIMPNVAAMAMAPFGHIAGSASALLGTVQFGVGAVSGALVGLLHNGTAIPMTAGVAGCAVTGWIVQRWSANRT